MTGQHSLTPTKAIPSACLYMCVSRTRASLLALSMCKRAFDASLVACPRARVSFFALPHICRYMAYKNREEDVAKVSSTHICTHE